MSFGRYGRRSCDDHHHLHLSISLDGFVAGPRQSREAPVGLGGHRLHEWHWHAGEPGNEADAGMRDELILDVVPVLLGSGERLFDGVDGPGLEPIEVVHSPHASHIRYPVGR